MKEQLIDGKNGIPTIIFFVKNYAFIILKINSLVKAFFAYQFILSIK
jgi:hypothetical protein